MTAKKRLQVPLEKMRRMMRERPGEAPDEFEPEEQPPPEAKTHHFLVNGRFREERLEDLSEDVFSITAEPAEHVDLIPFVRQQVGLRLMNWHSSQGDPIYAVGSTYFDERGAYRIYPQMSVLESARSRLETLYRKEHEQEAKQELDVLREWLDWELQQAKMVNNPRQNHGHVSVVAVRFSDGTEHEVEDAVELDELEHEHGYFVGATLRSGRSTQKAFWGEWARKGQWPRSMEDVVAWFNTIEHFTDEQLRAVSRVWQTVARPSNGSAHHRPVARA